MSILVRTRCRQSPANSMQSVLWYLQILLRDTAGLRVNETDKSGAFFPS